MLINWFTVLAQIVNFLILIYLLKRFLFKPILKAMAEREKKMAENLNRAEKAEQDARAKALALEQEKADLVQAREKLLSQAREQVSRWREETLQEAKEEVETLRGAWMANMTRDRQAFLDGLKQRLVEQVVDIGGKVVRDLANQDLNRQVLRVFVQKVMNKKDEMARHVARGGVVVQSGIPLEEADEKALMATLSQWFPAESGIRLESAPELGLGIQLVTGDRKVAWHLADYLRDLEKEIMENLFKGLARNDARVAS